MIRNYIKISTRNLIRQKGYSIINIIGLSAGITSFLLIILFVKYQNSFDRNIPNIDNIYRVVEIQKEEGVGIQHVAITMGPLAPALKKDIPEVINTLRLAPAGVIPLLVGEKFFNQSNVYFADSSIFSFFNIKLIKGNPQKALNELGTAVISRKVAEKYFVSVDSALNKMIKVKEGGNLIILGVMEDLPENMHVNIEMLMSYATAQYEFPWLKQWDTNSLVTYILLKEGTDPKSVEAKFPKFIRNYITFDKYNSEFAMYLQPLTDVYLKSGHIKFHIQDKMGSLTIYRIFVIVGIIILIIACINFINLSIARSMKRAKEVGMRKAMGATRRDLIYQFIGESGVITFMSILISLALVELILPFFNLLLNTQFTIDFIGNPVFNLGLLGILVIVSLFSGAYPAFYLSRFDPVKVMKGIRETPASFTVWLRNTLLVIQFIFTIGLLFSILVIRTQMNYVAEKDLGINYQDVVYIKLFDRAKPAQQEKIKAVFNNNPEIRGLSFVSFYNGVAGRQGPIYTMDSAEQKLTVRFGYVDAAFFPMMGIQFVEGRNFSDMLSSDTSGGSVILNESAVKAFGWKTAVGKRLKPLDTDTTRVATVIGVIKDYHYYSLHAKIEPAIYICNPSKFMQLLLKINRPENNTGARILQAGWNTVFPKNQITVDPLMVLINKKLSEIIPNYMVEPEFVKTSISRQYKTEWNTYLVFGYFTIVSILISCLGLLGLTSMVSEQKTREIGIRKVLGASVAGLTVLLLKRFLLLIVLAGIISIPLAWYTMSTLLSSFAYRIDISLIFALEALLITLIISIGVIIYKSLRTALSDPVDSLKYD